MITILGCGTSTGVPLIQCNCPVCVSDHPKNKRLRASVWIQIDGKSILIDTSTDLREQALRAKIPRVDAVLYTHPHADHIHGIDELRSFNFIQKGKIPVYGNHWTCQELRIKFSYIFEPKPTLGGGIPELELHEINASLPEIDVLGVKIVPIPVQHGRMQCVGYRIGSTAYITDCSEIPEPSLEKLQGLSTLILDCVRLKPHGTHFNLDQALMAVEKIQPETTFLTHLSHDFEYTEWSKKLPEKVFLAYDGLNIQL
jgi:phosphoribosyl 1,2-cyclic phosphate phosphodiesterase